VPASPDHALAERLERFAASDVRRFAETAASLFPGQGGEFLEVGGGVASYVGPHSPANGAIGLGFCGEVTHGQIATVERFFLDRGEEPITSVCPVAHPSLVRILAERGWVVGTFENVLTREIRPEDGFDPPGPGVSITTAVDRDELNDWALLAARGFSAPQEPTEPELRLATVATHRGGARFLFGLVDGVQAGTGQLEITDDIGWLSGDTTMPQFRRRGVQGALQRARLEVTRDAGCSLAVTESVPGSPSQRNMERLGFRVAYTRVDARYPLSRRSETPKGTDS
jgi:GNAT superfamily N-acetyltransferase